jgi:phenylacetaldehyde dehydrogenase
MEAQLDLIDGVRCAPSQTLDIELTNPSTGGLIARVAQTDPTEVDRAIAAADRVDKSGSWRLLSIADRAAALLRVADELDQRGDRIGAAESLGSGVVISIARLFGGSLAGSFRDAVEHMRNGALVEEVGESDRPVEILRIPWGATAVLVPWNAPAAMAAKKCAYALAAGAPVILKPPERAPYGCNVLAEAIAAAGLPNGVFQMVHGGADVGVQLTTDPRIRCISFTGSVTTGRAIAIAAAADFKAVQLELGGNNPVIIMPDADISQAAKSIATGMTKLNGQWCEGPGKIFVPLALERELVSALLAELGGVVIGAHDDADAAMGPLAYREHRDQLQARVDDLVQSGATAHQMPTAPDLPGWFWPPMVVTDAPEGLCVDELFGPVVTVHAVGSIDVAIDLANASPYGLAGYVFGTDIDAAMAVARRIRFGEVKVNGTSLLDLCPQSVQSFWRGSGVGGHGDRDVFRFFCGAQIVGVDRPGLPI